MELYTTLVESGLCDQVYSATNHGIERRPLGKGFEKPAYLVRQCRPVFRVDGSMISDEHLKCQNQTHAFGNPDIGYAHIVRKVSN